MRFMASLIWSADAVTLWVLPSYGMALPDNWVRAYIRRTDPSIDDTIERRPAADLRPPEQEMLQMLPAVAGIMLTAWADSSAWAVWG
jgi:hypothetical protein